MMIDVGAVVANKYELVRLLGRGSMGEVWVAHHKTLGEKLALKLLTQGPQGSDEVENARQAAARFQFEAQVAARLSRKTRHIVRVTDHGDEEGLAYLVMELLDGQTLENALTRTPMLPLGSVVKMVTQIARALTQAHGEGVLHRDLKPANVFLSTDEDGVLLVKLLDFGIARAIHAHKIPKSFVTHKGVVFGTPAYMSPEQARASSKLDHRCDIWALATIAYEALTGDLPVAGSDAEELLKNLCANRIIPLRSRNPRLPSALGAFFDRAFAERIDDRYASATEFAQGFEAACGVHAPDATAILPVSSPKRPAPAAFQSGSDAPTPALASGSLATASTPFGWPLPRKRIAMAATAFVAVALAAAGVAWRASSPAAAPDSTAASVANAPPGGGVASGASPAGASGANGATGASGSSAASGASGASTASPSSPAQPAMAAAQRDPANTATGQTAPRASAITITSPTAPIGLLPAASERPSFARKSVSRPAMGPAVPVAPVTPTAPPVTAAPAPAPAPKPLDKSDVL